MAPTSALYSDLVLCYKYTALHPRIISTALGFSAAPSGPNPLPRGYCKFSFAVQEAKMKDTFGKHLVKVVMKEAGVRLGTAAIDLSGLLCQPLAKGRRSLASQVTVLSGEERLTRLAFEVRLTEGDSHGGALPAALRWEDASRISDSRHLGEDPELGDLMVAARGEVESWKEEQKAEFRRSLAELDAGHLQLLGQEWREREKCLQDNMERVRQLEEKLKVQIARMKKEKLGVEDEKKGLEAEKVEILKVRQEVNGGKSSVISKLKLKVKELQAELETKIIEADSFKRHLKVTKKELDRKEAVKNERKSREESLSGKIVRLKAEKNTWQANLELAEKEKDFYSTNCEVLNGEVQQLREERELLHSAQIGRLEEQVKELSSQLETRPVPEARPRSASPSSPGPQVDERVRRAVATPTA